MRKVFLLFSKQKTKIIVLKAINLLAWDLNPKMYAF